MSRAFYLGHWFKRVSPHGTNESEFENLLVCNPALIHPKAWLVPFKKTVYSQEASARADLALIDKDYQEWFVVEVETSHHSLLGHVLPQARALRDAIYGEEIADYLLKGNDFLDGRKLSTLVRTTSPRVVVIADASREDWRLTLAGADITLITIETFRSDMDRHLFVVHGSVPRFVPNVLARCFYNSMLPRTLELDSAANVPCSNGEQLDVLVNGSYVVFVRLDTASKSFLRSTGPIDLRQGKRYVLIRNSSGDLELTLG